MYARVTFATAAPGRMDDITKVMKDSILPAAKKQKGFKGLLHMGNRSSGKGMVIVMWNTEADMMAGESSTYYREQIAKVASLLSGQPTTEHYEVNVRG
jgi:heme-degrading monooxygenase HmoA